MKSAAAAARQRFFVFEFNLHQFIYLRNPSSNANNVNVDAVPHIFFVACLMMVPTTSSSSWNTKSKKDVLRGLWEQTDPDTYL